jgi:hypothetical protein
MNRRILVVSIVVILLSAFCFLTCGGGGSGAGVSRLGVNDDDDSPSGDDDNNAPDDDATDDDASPDDDSSDETTWTDPTTGYMWQNGAAVGAVDYVWAEAQNYCAGLFWGGYSGWRLPDINEIRSLIRGCAATETGGSCEVTDSCLASACGMGTCDRECSFLGGPGPGGAFWPPELSGVDYWYWSSSPVTDYKNAAWLVNFYGGAIYNDERTSARAARCVRP